MAGNQLVEDILVDFFFWRYVIPTVVGRLAAAEQKEFGLWLESLKKGEEPGFCVARPPGEY
jgi:hypothetical protein